MKTTTKKMVKKSVKKTNIGPRLIASLTGLRDSLRNGEDVPTGARLRTIKLPEAPKPYTPEAIKLFRRQVNASQEQAAALLGLSVDQIRSIEQGRRKPAPTVRRLLDVMTESPERWAKMLQ